MKKTYKYLLLSLMTLCLMAIVEITLADPPQPPADHGSSGNQPPVGAPIDGGLGILVILAGSAAYGGKKLYNARKKDKVEEPATEN